MKLIIDTRNGIAGDILCAGLIGLGADSGIVTGAMEIAGNLMGGARVTHGCTGSVHRIHVDIMRKPDHLHASQARNFLNSAIIESGMTGHWQETASRVLEILAEAESYVHAHHPALKGHFHGHEAMLHEASDIILDIMGMAAGLRALDIHSVEYLDYVNVGSGKVTFSHGTLEVPTPATRHILEKHAIAWKMSDSGLEMATPTGASILAGCGASRILSEPLKCNKILAGGTRPLPPVAFMLGNDKSD
jgi:uncharacterized protein (DUF111 family)